MIEALSNFSKFPIPANVPVDIKELVSRYGRVRLTRVDGGLRLVSSTTPPSSKSARPPEGRARLPRRARRPDQLRHRRRLPRRPQAGIDRGRIPGRRPRRLHLGRRPRHRPPRDHRQRPRLARPRLPATGRRGVPRRGDVRERLGRRDRLPCGAGRDDRRHRRDGGIGEEHARPDDEHDGRRAVAPGDPRQDRDLDAVPRHALHGRIEGDLPCARSPRTRSSPTAPRRISTIPTSTCSTSRDWGLIIYDEVHLLPRAGLPDHGRHPGPPPPQPPYRRPHSIREDGREEDVFSA